MDKTILRKYKSNVQHYFIFASEVLTIVLAYILSYFIRFDGTPPYKFLALMIRLLPLVVALQLAALIYFKVYRNVCRFSIICRYVTLHDFLEILKATTVSTIVFSLIVLGFQLGHPRSVLIINWLLVTAGLCGVRLNVHFLSHLFQGKKRHHSHRRVLLVGAGDAGEQIMQELIHMHKDYDVIGLIDDDEKKQGKLLHGIPILGGGEVLPFMVEQHRISEVIIGIPTLTPEKLRRYVALCMRSRVKYRVTPNLEDIVDGTVHVDDLRTVRLEDILGREEIRINKETINSLIKEKTILVTGAAGSIGSELCRQIASYSPRKLVLFDRNENDLYFLDLELWNYFKDINRVISIGDIGDRKRFRDVLNMHKPDIIFHAAAYKHVPLMETNSTEAIKNNVLGTQVVVEESYAFGVKKLIMLSTDKAVDPINLMGVSKKIAEMYLTSFAKKHNTCFSAVRFGNVLGSMGSLVPILKRQIEMGGPVTVTDPKMKRYLMTIPEAVGLVLEAGHMSKGGEIFVLEMGKEVKIVNVARDLIRLAGFRPDEEIKIVFTGLRPGEKMDEKLVASDELIEKTRHKKINLIKEPARDSEVVFNGITELSAIMKNCTLQALTEKIKEIVPSYDASLFIKEQIVEDEKC